MSWASVALELALAALLIAALGFGWRLERKLKALRESHLAFVGSVRDLDAAALRADAGLKALREALDDAHDGLHDRIQKGRALKAELDALLARAERLPAGSVHQTPIIPEKAGIQDRVDAVSTPSETARAAPLGPGFGREDGASEQKPPSPARLPRFRRQGAA
jgi:hypothetical protein